MKLILKQDVLGLGYKDDVVEVRNGYGRNYLIPQGKAILATESALKVLAEDLRQRAHKIAKAKAEAEAIAATLQGVSLVIETKVSKTGTIYGSVTNIQVAKALADKGHNIDRKIIALKGVIKEVGKYVATIHLHKEVLVEIPFEVISDEPIVVEQEPEVVEEAPVVEAAPAAEAEEAPAAVEAEETTEAPAAE